MLVRPLHNSLSSSTLLSISRYFSSTSTSNTSISNIDSAARGPHIAIIGSGISGLSLIHWLNNVHTHSNPKPSKITLIESKLHLGGWINTYNSDEYLFELGPRSLQSRGGISTFELINNLNIQSKIIHADQSAKKRYLYSVNNNKPNLILTPTGFNSTLFKFPWFFDLIKGILHELITPKRTENTDESVHSFVSRRFNLNIADNLIDPLIAGIYSGDPKKLSIKNCLAILNQYEMKYGSIVKGILFGKSKPIYTPDELKLLELDWVKALKQAQIYSFQDGLGYLVKSLVNSIKDTNNNKNCPLDIKYLTSVRNMRFLSDGIELTMLPLHQAPIIEKYDYVFSTIGSNELAELVVSESDKLAELLKSIEYSSVYVVNIGYNSDILPVKGFGVLAATNTNSDILGITFDSHCFPQQNKNNNNITRLTVMIGGDRKPYLLQLNSDEIQKLAMKNVNSLFNLTAETSKPEYISATKQVNCIPQYTIGHSERIKNIENTVDQINRTVFSGKNRLNLLGASYNGVSLNDLIAHSKQIAMKFYN